MSEDFITSIIAIIVVIFLFVLMVLFLDRVVNTEIGISFCEKEYGEEFVYKYDDELDFGYCGKITTNGTLIKYYFNDEDVKKYCKNKFWKLDDCENGLFR